MDSRSLALLAIAALCGGGIYFASQSEPKAPNTQKPAKQEATQDSPQARPTPKKPQTKLPNKSEPIGSAAGSPAGSTEADAARNNSAIDFLKGKEYEKAVEIFEELHERHADEDVYRSNLAEALARWASEEYDQFPAESLAKLERAFETDPERLDWQPVLERWRTQVRAQEGFYEDQSVHFTLRYDGDRSDLLNTGYRAILEDLESAYQDYGEFFDTFPVEAGNPKFAAVMYDREAFDSVTGIGEWAGGAYDGTIRVPVRNFHADRERIRGTLRHELVHAYLDVLGHGDIPGWLNEGLAQYLAPETVAARQRIILNARRRLQGQTLFALKDLGASLATIQDPAQVAKAYDQALGLTGHIAEQYGERILVHMAKGASPAATFQERIGVALDRVLEDFAEGL